MGSEIQAALFVVLFCLRSDIGFRERENQPSKSLLIIYALVSVGISFI